MSDGRLANNPRRTLLCAECGSDAAKDAKGWRAVLTVGDEGAEDVEGVAVFCPTCAERGFGG